MTAIGVDIEVPARGRAAGKLLALDGESAQLDSLYAAAPGTPLKLFHPEHGQLEVKAQRSQRTEGGRFVVRARFVNLRREVREALLAALTSEDSPTSEN